MRILYEEIFKKLAFLSADGITPTTLFKYGHILAGISWLRSNGEQKNWNG